MKASTHVKDRGLRVLVAVTHEEDYETLRNLLTDALHRPVQITHMHSPSEIKTCLDQQKYDLVLWDIDGQTADTAENDRLREHDSQARILYLRQQPSYDTIHQLIQKSACNYQCGCDPRLPCQALGILKALEAYRAKKFSADTNPDLAKLRRVVDQSPDLVMITDPAGAIEYVNPAFETITGYSRQEVIGQPFGILKSDQQPGELFEEMWDTVLSGRVFRGIIIDRKKNGEPLIVEKAMTPLVNRDGQITHFISTAKDITDRRKLEVELQQAQRMDAIGRLAGGVAHDFNNLLMVISAYAELTLDALHDEHPLSGNIAEILNASRKAADLTRQLLAFGKKQMLLPQTLDLNNVIAGISRMLPRLIGEDIQLKILPAKDLGKVKADPVQIEQVIMNLAANARDAMPSGGKLTIETANVVVDDDYLQRRAIVPRGNYVLLAVTDSGQGIAPEHLAHIFEPFYTTKAPGKGTGLGLATVYGIVKQSGGYIWVYSEPELGTTFKIYLPLIRSTHVHVDDTNRLSKVSGGSETLLLVEDEEPVRESEREFLVRHGYTVLAAADGEEALQLAAQHRGKINLMITDVVMPKMGGAQLAEQIGPHRPDMEVLYVSGYAESTVTAHGKIDVRKQFLQKPFSLWALSSKVREILDTCAGKAVEVS